jgi:hypothetical protein
VEKQAELDARWPGRIERSTLNWNGDMPGDRKATRSRSQVPAIALTYRDRRKSRRSSKMRLCAHGRSRFGNTVEARESERQSS